MAKSLKTKEINLLAASKVKEGNNKGLGKKIILTAIPVILLAGCVVLFIKYSSDNRYYISEIENANRFIESDEVISEQDELDIIRNEMYKYSGFKERYESIGKLISNWPEPHKAMLERIFSEKNDVSILNISFSTAGINLQCSAKDYKSAALYVQRLRNTGYFADIEYTGFESGGEVYSFVVKLLFTVNEEVSE